MTGVTNGEDGGSDFGKGLPQSLMLAQSVRNVYAYTVPEGRDWRDCLKPEFWRAYQVAKSLQPGSRIEILSADRQTQFEIIVLSSNPYATTPQLGLGFRAIWPTDLALPGPTITGAPRFRVRPQPALGGCWEIVDRSGSVVADGISSRESALVTLAAIETRDERADIATHVANLAIAQANAPPIIPRPKKGDPDQAVAPKADGRAVINVGAHR